MVARDLGEGGEFRIGEAQGIFKSSEIVLYDTVMVDTQHCAFIKTIELYSSKRDS